MNFTVEVTKNKIPCLWEQGGAKNEKDGFALLITGKDGQAKMPILVKTNVYEQSEKHALLPATVKSHIVEVNRKNNKYNIDIYEIINIKGNQAETKKLCHYSNGIWDKEPSMKFYDAIQQGIKKTKDNSTFAPYYIME